MVWWLERSLVKQEDLGLIPTQTKWFYVLGYKELEKMDPDMINCMILGIHVENKIILSHAI